MENVEAALVDDDGTVTLRGGEGSGLRLERIAEEAIVLQASQQRRRRSDLVMEVRHFSSQSSAEDER